MGNPVADSCRYKRYSYAHEAYNDIERLNLEIANVRGRIAIIVNNINAYTNSIIPYFSNAVNYTKQGQRKMDKAEQYYKKHYNGTDSARKKTEKLELHLQKINSLVELSLKVKQIAESNLQVLQRQLETQQAELQDLSGVLNSVRYKLYTIGQDL